MSSKKHSYINLELIKTSKKNKHFVLKEIEKVVVFS